MLPYGWVCPIETSPVEACSAYIVRTHLRYATTTARHDSTSIITADDGPTTVDNVAVARNDATVTYPTGATVDRTIDRSAALATAL